MLFDPDSYGVKRHWSYLVIQKRFRDPWKPYFITPPIRNAWFEELVHRPPQAKIHAAKQ
jgi:hypothetical protein